MQMLFVAIAGVIAVMPPVGLLHEFGLVWLRGLSGREGADAARVEAADVVAAGEVTTLVELAAGRRQGAASNDEVALARTMGAIKFALPSGLPSAVGSASFQ